MTHFKRLFSYLTVLTAVNASAGPLSDPTRPPAGMVGSPPPAQGGASHASAARPQAAAAANAPASAAAPVEPPDLPQVQLIRVPQGGAASALVDGRLVQVGDVLDAAVVVAIDANGLLLRGQAGTRRLWLLDAVMRPEASSETRLAQHTKPPARATQAASGTPPNAPLTAAQAVPAVATPTPITLAGKKP